MAQLADYCATQAAACARDATACMLPPAVVQPLPKRTPPLSTGSQLVCPTVSRSLSRELCPASALAPPAARSRELSARARAGGWRAR